MGGILISMLSGPLMSIQGVFNTGVMEKTGVWVAPHRGGRNCHFSKVRLVKAVIIL